MRHPVLLHGFTGSGASWEPVLDGLASASLAPVLVDLPGHGRDTGAHDPSRFTLPATLDAIAAAGDWPADLIGYSMGGRLALHFAVAFPERVRRLVLESASPGLADARERAERVAADEALALRIEEGGTRAFVEAWEALPMWASQARLDPTLRARQRQRREANDPRSLAAALRGLGTGALPSLWDRLPALGVPTLLLVGAEDARFVDIARRAAARMPDARVVVVDGCGHTVHLEEPAAWLAAVLPFLSGGGSPTG